MVFNIGLEVSESKIPTPKSDKSDFSKPKNKSNEVKNNEKK